jgi:hypothetical protein
MMSRFDRSSMKRSVASSSTSFLSSPGWASKSKSSSRQGAGGYANFEERRGAELLLRGPLELARKRLRRGLEAQVVKVGAKPLVAALLGAHRLAPAAARAQSARSTTTSPTPVPRSA